MRFKQVKEVPDVPTVVMVEAVLMPNRELICYGKSLGFDNDLERLVTVEYD